MADIVSEEDFAKAQAYGVDKSRFDFVATAYNQLQTVAMIVYDWLPLLWDYSGSLMYKFGGLGPEYEVRAWCIVTLLLKPRLILLLHAYIDFAVIGVLCYLCYHLYCIVLACVPVFHICGRGTPRVQ